MQGIKNDLQNIQSITFDARRKLRYGATYGALFERVKAILDENAPSRLHRTTPEKTCNGEIWPLAIDKQVTVHGPDLEGQILERHNLEWTYPRKDTT